MLNSDVKQAVNEIKQYFSNLIQLEILVYQLSLTTDPDERNEKQKRINVIKRVNAPVELFMKSLSERDAAILTSYYRYNKSDQSIGASINFSCTGVNQIRNGLISTYALFYSNKAV